MYNVQQGWKLTVARGYWILLRVTGFQKVVARRATGFQASLLTQNIINILKFHLSNYLLYFYNLPKFSLPPTALAH